MYRINAILVVVFMPFYITSAANLDAVGVEETTDSMVDVYDPSSDETFDPQKDYADFKTSYEKLYKISGSSYILPSSSMQRPQQSNIKSWPQFQVPINDDDAETEDSTNVGDIGSNDANDIISTTIPPSVEQQTISQLYAENGAMHPMNDIRKSTQRPVAFASFEQFARNADLMKRKFNPTPESNTDFQNEGDLANGMANSAHQASVVFVQNASNLHNESTDYINDDGNEANYTQTMTSIPYSMDTTITSQPSSPVFISTRSPINPFSTSTLTPLSIVTIAPPVIDDVTPNHSPGKKSKKIEALPPRVYKYSADEIVRKYLDDTFLRPPLATLINTTPEALRKAKKLWKSTLKPNSAIDIVLVAFNSSGVGVTYSFKNTPTMIAGLDSVQDSRDLNEGGSGFYGIYRASELVPYDSAIFISTDRIPQDINLMKNAANILLKKRIRLYLIWFGDENVDENETSIGGSLGEVALRSGGEILRVTEESLGNGEMGLVTHFLQNDIQGAQVLEIPVNKTDSNLYIQIQGSVDEAVLSSPNDGKLVNLLSTDSVRTFSPGSVAIYVLKNDMNRPELVANLNVSNGPHGIYMLKITPQLSDDDEPQENYNLLINTEFDQQFQKQDTDSLNYVSMVGGKQSFRKRRSEHLSEENEPDDEIVWPENQNSIQFDGQTVTTNGTDIESRSGKNILQTVTKIDLGAQSQLLANPGSSVQIHYEITNLRDVPMLHYFQVTDEQRFLRSLNPPYIWIPPGQTRNAVVMCYIPPNIEIGTTDKITFTSQGTASQSAMLTVTSPQSAGLDRRVPLIYWNYGSRCFGRTDAGRCAGSIWSVEITTLDPDTGILRVQSNPRGILIRDQYTAGTTQEVKATYSASCCTPRVTITSYDLAGNQKTITLDVNEYYLSPVEIVAIVLGVVLLIIIIAAIIWAIVYCCKKHRNTRELPVYRSRSERERAT